MPLQKPQSRNSEVTKAKVMKRFLPSGSRNSPIPFVAGWLEGLVVDVGEIMMEIQYPFFKRRLLTVFQIEEDIALVGISIFSAIIDLNTYN